MTPQDRTSDLAWEIEHRTPTLATLGNTHLDCELVTSLLTAAGKSFHVVDTTRMVYASDIEAFFKANGIVNPPDVLILHKFNSVSRSETYFIKGLLLDEQARGSHPVFEKMKQVILTCDRHANPMDDVLASCIRAVVSETI